MRTHSKALAHANADKRIRSLRTWRRLPLHQAARGDKRHAQRAAIDEVHQRGRTWFVL